MRLALVIILGLATDPGTIIGAAAEVALVEPGSSGRPGLGGASLVRLVSLVPIVVLRSGCRASARRPTSS